MKVDSGAFWEPLGARLCQWVLELDLPELNILSFWERSFGSPQGAF